MWRNHRGRFQQHSTNTDIYAYRVEFRRAAPGTKLHAHRVVETITTIFAFERAGRHSLQGSGHHVCDCKNRRDPNAWDRLTTEYENSLYRRTRSAICNTVQFFTGPVSALPANDALKRVKQDVTNNRALGSLLSGDFALSARDCPAKL